jgi:antibiotic biosynthesis monooxygenase (ABM) superfamily enzyme
VRRPFAIVLFIGNVVSVLILNYLVPWTGNRFAWWLQPRGRTRSESRSPGRRWWSPLYGA